MFQDETVGITTAYVQCHTNYKDTTQMLAKLGTQNSEGSFREAFRPDKQWIYGW